MPDEKVLEILIRAKDQASKVMKRVGAAAKQAMKVAAVAVAAFAAFSVAKFVEFEGQMNEVFTLMPDISADAMDEMTDQVKDFSREFGTLPNEVVPALYSAISAGVPADNVFDFLEVAQKAAVGGVTDLETAVDGISSVVNAYGSDVISASEASDIMFTGVRLGKTTFDELAASLFQVIPTAASLGVSFEDVTAAIAVMTAQGTPTSVATTQIRGLFVELSKSTTVVSQKFQELSGQSFAEFISTGGDVASALEILAEDAGPAVVQVMKDLQTEGSDLNKVFKEEAGESIEAFLAGGGTLTEALNMVADEAGFTGDAMTDMFGSVEAANAALAITSGGGDAFSAALEEMGASAGATEEAYARMEEGLGRSFDKIKAAVVVTAIEFGEKLAPVVARFAEWLIENMPKIQESVGKAFNFISKTVVPAVLIAFNLLRGTVRRVVEIVQRLIEVWPQYAPLVKIIAGLILTVMIPIWISMGIQATITAAKVAAAWVVQNVSAIGATVVHSAQIVAQVAKWLILGVKAMFHAAVVVAGWVMTGVAAVAQTIVMVAQAAIFVARWAFMGTQSLLHAAKVAAAWVIAMGPIAIVIALVVALVVAVVLNWDKIKAAIIAAATAIWDWLSGWTERIKTVISDAWEAVKTAVMDKVGALMDFLSGAWDSIKDAGASAFQWLSDTIDGIFSGIASFARGYVNTIIGVINLLIGGFNTVIGLASKIPIIGDKIAGFKIPEIPQLALGAIVTAPTLAVVGDNKREPEAVLPLSRLDSMLKNSGGGGPVFQRGAFDGAVFQVSPQTGSASDFFDSMQDVGLEVNGRKGLE